MEKNNTLHIDTFGAPWAEKGGLLLPRSLRDLWAREALPSWISKDLRLPHHATFRDLDEGVWKNISTCPPRVRKALAILVRIRGRQIAKERCLYMPWPTGLHPDQVPWTKRTRTALLNAGLYDQARLTEGITFGDIFRLKSAGVLTVLDFSATLESAMRQFALFRAELEPPEGSNSTAANDDRIDTLLAMASESWAAQVSGEDRRFPELPKNGMSLRDYVHSLLDDPDITANVPKLIALTDALPGLKEKIKQLEELTLEQSLQTIIKSILGDKPAERIDAMSGRFGWAGSEPTTLQATGDRLQLTRERVRQIEAKVLKRLPRAHPVFLPALDKALAALSSEAPLSNDAAMTLLKKVGVTRFSFDPAVLLTTASMFGRNHDLDISTVKGTRFIQAAVSGNSLDNIPQLSRRLTGMNGAFSVYQLHRETESKIEVDKLRDLLLSFPDLISLDDEHDWWFSKRVAEHRNRLINLTTKMLSVAAPQSIRSIREGINRVCRWRGSREAYRGLLIAPPIHVLARIFELHPAFEVADGMVSSKKPIPYAEMLGDAERIIVDVLRSSATGVMDRATLMRLCVSAGVNETTFGIMGSYSPILEQAATGLWKLRGVVVHPSAIEALRLAVRERPLEKRIISYGWNPDGKLWLAVRLPQAARSMVVGTPTAIAHYFKDKKFEAKLDDGTPCGSLSLATDSVSLYGFSPFVRIVGAEEGDVAKMVFDLSRSTVTISIVEESSLDD